MYNFRNVFEFPAFEYIVFYDKLAPLQFSDFAELTPIYSTMYYLLRRNRKVKTSTYQSLSTYIFSFNEHANGLIPSKHSIAAKKDILASSYWHIERRVILLRLLFL